MYVFFAFPFYWMIITAFKTNAEAIQLPPTLWPQNFDFSGFETIFAQDLTRYLKNSIVVLFWTTILQPVILVLAAYAFARYSFKGKKFFFGWIISDYRV